MATSIQWNCNQENYQSILLPLRHCKKPIVFVFNLTSEKDHIFYSMIPPLSKIEKIELAGFEPSDVEAVRISNSNSVIWQGTNQLSFTNLNLPTNNVKLILEVKYKLGFPIPPIFCWARVTMSHVIDNKKV